MKHNRKVLRSLAAFVFFVTTASSSLSYGQTPPPQQPGAPGPQNLGAVEDPIRQLNLTPEQREQIRSIRQQTNVERAAINRRVGEANRALEAALDSDNPDEAAVEQRIRDLAAAQAESMRMRISTEVKIRRVLTVEQRTLLRSLRQQARETRRERLEILDQRQRRRQERQNSLRNQRNGMGPLFPGRGLQRRTRP
jgi:Spy/CpxP family protein refolding chaperone